MTTYEVRDLGEGVPSRYAVFKVHGAREEYICQFLRSAAARAYVAHLNRKKQ